MLKYDKIRPLLNRILIKKIENPNKTTGGILLNNTGVSKIGLVVEVGSGKFNQKGEIIKPSVLLGQYVLLPDYGGVRVPKPEKNEEEHWIYQEDDILGVAEGIKF
jgi:chaperonin GroES